MKTKSTLLILLCCFYVLVAWAQNPLYTIVHNNLVRSYILHLPSNFVASDTLPLVFCLHGLNQTAKRISQVSGFDTIADRERFVVVYPYGVDTVWNTFSNPYHSGADDAGFISALIDTLRRDYHINLNRVYSTGMSNGGFMSYKLACELSERIAAIAPLAGAFTDSMRFYCHPNRAMPVLDIHGSSDFVVGYNGGIVNISTAQTLQYWRTYNNCPATEVETNLPDISTTDNSTVTTYSWIPCDNNSEVMHYKVVGGGHTWPGSSVTFGGLGGATNYDIDASEVIWEFFNRYTLQGKVATAINDAGEEQAGISVYPNPVSDILNLSLTNKNITNVRLIGLCGNTIVERPVINHETIVPINVSQQPAGIYLLQTFTAKGIDRVFKIVIL